MHFSIVGIFNCRPDMFYYSGSCYKLETPYESVTWHAASRTCRQIYGGHLVSYMDAQEERFVGSRVVLTPIYNRNRYNDDIEGEYTLYNSK